MTRTIRPSLVENGSSFQSEFFRRFELKHHERPLLLADGIAKDYFFPTLYTDVTHAVAMFFCTARSTSISASR